MTNYKSIYYKGLEYDISEFINKHPGGKTIIQNYLRSNQQITQLFKSIHSREAEKQLLNLKAVGKVQRSKNEKIYLKIQERVSKLYQASYVFEISNNLFVVFLFLLVFFISSPTCYVASITISQIMAAWSCHSQLHSHNSFSQKSGKIMGGLILGLSWKWWIKKHINHHIFTNNQQFDQDINHNYRTILFPFLLFKWRIQSIIHSLINCSSEIIMIAIHYYILCKMKCSYVLLGITIASFFITVVVFSNHEKQIRYRREHLDDFLTHQMQTTVDYDAESDWLLMVFGGFQYHVQHHLFPQIPFYKLLQGSKIIREELLVFKKEIQVSSMI